MSLIHPLSGWVFSRGRNPGFLAGFHLSIERMFLASVAEKSYFPKSCFRHVYLCGCVDPNLAGCRYFRKLPRCDTDGASHVGILSAIRDRVSRTAFRASSFQWRPRPGHSAFPGLVAGHGGKGRRFLRNNFSFDRFKEGVRAI